MSFRAFYDEHVRFVWRALLRIGVQESDLSDAVQDVFVVVHRKLPEFDERAKVTTWLFAICMRVASERRRRAHLRHELCSGQVPAAPSADEPDADALVERRRARELLETVLDRMPDEQRLVFSLFEFEGMTGDEIAELLAVPIGTVRSRLRLARESFEASVARLRARDRAWSGALLRADGTEA
jgi:RNA polymerase sigma-70 factor (ECF subfamily)